MAKRKPNKFANQEIENAENKSTKTAAAVAEVPAVKEVKAETEAKAEVKADVPAKKAPSEKKSASVKSPAAKKSESVSAAAEKSASKKAPDKAAKVIVQFNGKEYDTDEIAEMCRVAYKADNSRKQIRSLEIYIKPEEHKAYYVVNGKADGLSIDL